jgi:hypothetical protein
VGVSIERRRVVAGIDGVGPHDRPLSAEVGYLDVDRSAACR